MWMSLVEMNTWMRGVADGLTASHAASTSPSFARHSAAITEPLTTSAMRFTASSSPGDDAGNPASMMSTPSRPSCSAISSFSLAVRAMPGACSPSRSVVSKNRTSSGTGTTSGAGVGLAEPRHHRAKATADLLDPQLAVLLAQLGEPRIAGLRLGDPLPGEGPRRDLLEDALHLRPRLVGDDARPAREVAVLRRVADRVVHVLEPALVQQVHDQLQLVQALEVRDLGLVPGVHERLEPGLDQRRRPAAEHRLLAEQVGLGLLGERGLDDAGA